MTNSLVIQGTTALLMHQGLLVAQVGRQTDALNLRVLPQYERECLQGSCSLVARLPVTLD
jgi:hypothetical protein